MLTYYVARIASWNWAEWRWAGREKRGIGKRFLKEHGRMGKRDSGVLAYLLRCENS